MPSIPLWLQAGLWGLLAGAALLVGAALGFFAHVPPRLIAATMAFGSGVLVSALAFELMEEAYRGGGFLPAALGFAGGAAIYAGANRELARRGARHRKRSGDRQPSEEDTGGSGAAIAVGALLDGVPESIVLGLGLVHGGGVSVAMVAAVFLSNLPEGLSSAAGMRRAGRSAGYAMGVWAGIAVVSAAAAVVGYAAFRGLATGVVAATTGVAAGGILCMLADTMIPEAFEGAHDWAGILTAAGFLASFALTKL